MRIGLDARYISHGLIGGVHTYVYHLARELPRCAPEHEFVYYADEKAPFELADWPANAVLRTLRYRGRWSSLINDQLIGRAMSRDAVDLMHGPANFGPRSRVPLVVTLHDSINTWSLPEHLEGSRSPRYLAMMLYLGRLTRASLRRAARLITVSEHSRDDIATRTGFPKERITAIHHAAGAHFRVLQEGQALAACRARFGLCGPIILADGIKNPAAAIAAVDRLPKTLAARLPLVFYSREREPRPSVRAALGRGGVRFISRPSGVELAALMNLAAVFVFPSTNEGFGLPIVEAMGCGAPIIAARRAAIPEVLGDAGVLVDLEDPRQLADALRSVLEDSALADRLRRRALQRAQCFSWRSAARQTVDVYEAVLDEARGHRR